MPSALRIIHKAGWVHRDISPSNIYLYINPETGEKRGLIGDFEYSKRVGAGGKGDTMVVRYLLLYSAPELQDRATEQIDLYLLIGYTRVYGYRSSNSDL